MMSSSTPNLTTGNQELRSEDPAKVFTAAVLTVSDSCAKGERIDLSGPAVVETLTRNSFSVVATEIVPDDQLAIAHAIVLFTDEVRLVVTTGGTGVAARDVTPEATRSVCDRVIEGVAERMRFEGLKKTPLAALSRGLCCVRGQSIVLNVPGSPKGAVESLEAVIGLLPHALQLLSGNTKHD
jgi:molybdenum cofactor synthesis domain-containing protein